MAEGEQFTDKEIDEFVTKLMKYDPVRFVKYALIVIGRDILQSKAQGFKFSQESDLEKGKRFKIEVTGTINELSEK